MAADLRRGYFPAKIYGKMKELGPIGRGGGVNTPMVKAKFVKHWMIATSSTEDF